MLLLLSACWLLITWAIATQDVRSGDGLVWWWSVILFVACDILIFWIE